MASLDFTSVLVLSMRDDKEAEGKRKMGEGVVKEESGDCTSVLRCVTDR